MLLEALTSDWRHRAACRGADPRIFEDANIDTHPDLKPHERLAITRVRFNEAMKYCGPCPVRRECGQDATARDYQDVVRAGLTPGSASTAIRRVQKAEREGLKPPQGLRNVGRVGRPRNADRKPAQEPSRLLVPTAEAVRQCIVEGYDQYDTQMALGIGSETLKKHRRAALYALTEGDPDCVIRTYTIGPLLVDGVTRGAGKPSGSNGPGWLISRSACGRVSLVATRRGGLVRTRFLPSHEVEAVRSDVPVLGRFPSHLVAGEGQVAGRKGRTAVPH